MSRERILIVRIAALGDVAVASTVLSRIREQMPGAAVTWLCGERARPLVERFPGVDTIITVPESRLFGQSWLARLRALVGVWGRLLRHRFDRVILLHADARYRLLVLPTWPARLRRLSHGPRRTNPLPARFRGDEYARLLDAPDAPGPITRRFALADIRGAHTDTRANGRRARVVLVPGGARNSLRDDPLRRWPVEHYRELAARLLRGGCEVVLMGDQADAALRSRFEGLDVTDCLGTLTLTQAIDMLAGASVVVTPDAGPLHLARLVRTPIVALFGPTDPRHVVGENATDVRVLTAPADLPCRPCYDGRNYAACTNNLCMQLIPVDAAYTAVMSALSPARG